MTWRAVVTRDHVHRDGWGDHEHGEVVRVLVCPAEEFPTRAEAEAYRRRVLNASHDPTLDVAIEGPASGDRGAHRLDDATRTVGRDGLARARALLHQAEEVEP